MIGRRSLLLAGAALPASAYGQCVTDVAEEARTNVWLQSNNLADPATGLGGVGVPGPAVTANNTTAPDGTNTATRIVYSAVSSAGQACVLQQNPTMTVNPYSFSVYLRGNVGGERVYLSTTPDGVNYFRAPAVLTMAWQRFSLITTNLTVAQWFWLIGTDMRDASQTANLAQTIYAWGAQIEQGAFVTSYIPTTSAPVTRPVGLQAMSPTLKCRR